MNAGARVRTRPERSRVLIAGLAIGSCVGAGLALVWMYLVSGLVSIPPPLIALRTAGGAATGAVVGALLAVIVYALYRKARDELNGIRRDFVAGVTPPK